MNSDSHRTFGPNSPSVSVGPASTANPINIARQQDTAEATLRLIARLPAPSGLEDRVYAALAAHPRSARILSFPAPHRPASEWMRAAAAAAIVFVVAGGGWGIYTHVQPAQAGKAAIMPHPAMPHTAQGSGFSNAGAMRTPQLINGPVVVHPADVAHTASATQLVPVSPAKKVVARVSPALQQQPSAQAGHNISAQPSVTVAR
jgi:hypothetical protein